MFNLGPCSGSLEPFGPFRPSMSKPHARRMACRKVPLAEGKLLWSLSVLEMKPKSIGS
jgi:hypothetical protein